MTACIRRAVLIVQDQRGNGVQRVEQEVRVELVAQHFQLRFLRERRRAQRGFALLLRGLVVLDAEIERAPAQQQIGHRDGAAEDLEQRLELPVRLDQPLVGIVDHDAQRERDDIAGDEHVDDHDLRRLPEERAIDVAHRHGEHEAGHRGDADDELVLERLLDQQRAEVLRDRVRAPACGVQRPEERISVGAELIQSEHSRESLGHLARDPGSPLAHGGRLVACQVLRQARFAQAASPQGPPRLTVEKTTRSLPACR